jgi:hypothetical protein
MIVYNSLLMGSFVRNGQPIQLLECTINPPQLMHCQTIFGAGVEFREQKGRKRYEAACQN